MVRVVAISLLLPSLLLSPATAVAHQGSVTYLTLEVQGSTVRLGLRATRHDLAPLLDVAAGVNPLLALYQAKEAHVLRAAASYLTVANGGQRCALSRSRLDTVADTWVELRYTYHCPRRVELLTLRYDLLFDADPTHRALVALPGEGRGSRVITAARRTLTVEHEVSPWQNAADFLHLGVEHIFTGYDHLLFLLGLLLVAGVSGRRESRPRGLRAGLRYLVTVVTAFTIAHSVTLLGAALGLVTLPGGVVEPAIALSIAYVGLENIFLGDPPRRWLLTFVFGLIHGFGFAHILSEVGLPRSGLLLSLLSFNLGVELGQLAVVALLFPLIHLLASGRVTLPRAVLLMLLSGVLLGVLALGGLGVAPYLAPVLAVVLALVLGTRRWGYRRAVLKGGSALIALFGLLWAAERIFGFEVLGGYLG